MQKLAVAIEERPGEPRAEKGESRQREYQTVDAVAQAGRCTHRVTGRPERVLQWW